MRLHVGMRAAALDDVCSGGYASRGLGMIVS